jgi:hypothetical protein
VLSKIDEFHLTYEERGVGGVGLQHDGAARRQLADGFTCRRHRSLIGECLRPDLQQATRGRDHVWHLG